MSTSADDYFTNGDKAFAEEDIDEALELYTKAIDLDDQKPNYFLVRSVAFERVKKYTEALNDAKSAVKLTAANEDDDKVLAAKAYLRQGIAQYNLKDYQSAKSSLDKSKSLNPSEKTLASWIEKVEKELAKASPGTAPSAGGGPVSSRVRHEWFQNEEYMTVSVFIKNIKKELVEVGFSERALSVTIKMPTGSDFSLELDPLAHEIIPAESSFSVMSTKVEIKMKKAKVGIKWGSLEGEDSLPGMIGGGEIEGVKYPSSSKHGPKNWDQIEKEAEKDDSDKPDGDKALNALFQQIYRNADDDTKRAMIKSFTESSGTTLSTNWSDVGKGRVETKPPEGMIAKQYGK